MNSAAIWIAKPLERWALDVRQHFEVKRGVIRLRQEAGLIMVQQEQGGAIVNIGDWATSRPYLDYAAYFVAKGSIPALTRVLAVELAARNPRVRVNAILPGPVLFPQGLTAQEKSAIERATLVKREGTPLDLAQAVIFLLENTFVTGVCLPVDGGRTVYAPPCDD
jgi:pteridine reductase